VHSSLNARDIQAFQAGSQISAPQMHHRTAQIWTLIRHFIKALLRSACGPSIEPFVTFLSFTNLAIDSFVPAIAGCRLQYVDSIDAYQQATMDKLQESCSRTQKAL